MGEIGIMTSRMNEGGMSLEDLIDEEIRAAGFADLFEKSTSDLYRRTEVVESNHASLKSLLDSIDVQLKQYSDLLSVVELEDVSAVANEKSPKKGSEEKTVIVIDDDDDDDDDDGDKDDKDDKEDDSKNDDRCESDSNSREADEDEKLVTYTVSDFGCQTSFDEIQGQDSSIKPRESPKLAIPANRKSPGPRNAVAVAPAKSVTSLPQRSSPDTQSPPARTETPTKVLSRMSHRPLAQSLKDGAKNSSGLSLKMPASTSSVTNSSPGGQGRESYAVNGKAALESAKGASKEETSPALGFRVLKSPTDGLSSPVYSKVALPPSKPSGIPPQHSHLQGGQNTGTVMSRYRLIAPAPDLSAGSDTMSPTTAVGSLSSSQVSSVQPQIQGNVLSSSPPSPPRNKGSAVTSPSTSTAPSDVDVSGDTVVVPLSSDPAKSPPSFEEGTRVIGKRANELWYPGIILKVIKDKSNQAKYKVKYDKGTRGLLSINHIAPETSPDPAMLQVGSRVVGVYGKLDVLYAGIVAEIACLENKNRFLVFFDDGFAQYLSVKKLHYVRHTGKNVWEDVAQHSREFIQEYLEEFPERPMVRLKTGQWVKTEWRGKWLKAKVMQLDCSLVKMLFQIDNRSEWIYRGSTRIEPLYLELAGHGRKPRKRARKMTGRSFSSKMAGPYVDYSITKPCYGVSLYSKTDPKGEQQMQQELRRLQNLNQDQGQDTSKQSKTFTSSSSSSTSTVLSSPMGQMEADTSCSSSTQAENGAGPTGNDGADGSKGKSESKETSTGTRSVSLETSTEGTKRDAAQNTDIQNIPMEGGNTPTNGPLSFEFPSPNGNEPPVSFSESTKSIIEISTMRKRTNAGLVPKESPHRNGQVEVIDIDGTTSSVMMLATQSSKLTKHEWEAPWLRTDRRDARSVIDNKAHVVRVANQDISRRKQDVASLIEARLKTHVSDNRRECLAPKMPLVSLKSAVRGPHACSQSCCQEQVLDRKEKAKHNPLAVPLLLGWQREVARRHPGNKREVYYRSPCGRRLRSMGEVGQYLSVTTVTNVSIDQFCFDVDVSCKDGLTNSEEWIIDDYSRGSEPVSVPVANTVDNDFPPSIEYISSRIWAEGVNVILDPGFLACCDCTDNCQDKKKCACAQLTIAASAATGGAEDENCGYDYRRLMDSVPTGIYECNQNCACEKSQCFNRVVQNGLQQRVQVFKTEKKGWGLKAMDDIPAGAFVCTYGGQILNEDMADKEGRDFGDEYLAELDHIEVVEKAKEGYESGVSDLEEDDNVIYSILNPESTSSTTTGTYSDYSNSSSSEGNSDASISSDESYSSGKHSKSGDIEHAFGETMKLRKRKRTTRKPEKKRGVLAEENLVVDRESKAHALGNIADEKWCTLALKRTNDKQNSAATVLRRIVQEHTQPHSLNHSPHGAAAGAAVSTGEVTDTPLVQAVKGFVEDDAETQSSEFDFDDVSDSFYSSMVKSSKRNVACVTMEPDSTTPNTGGKVTLPTEMQKFGASATDPLDVIDLSDEHTGFSGERSAVGTSRVDLKDSGEDHVLNDVGKDTTGAFFTKVVPLVSIPQRTTVKEKEQIMAIKALQKAAYCDDQNDYDPNESQSVAKDGSKTISNEKAAGEATRDCDAPKKEPSQKAVTQLSFVETENPSDKVKDSDEAESSSAFTETEHCDNRATEQQKQKRDTLQNVIPSTVKDEDVIKQVKPDKPVICTEQRQEVGKKPKEREQGKSAASVEPNELFDEVETDQNTEKVSKGTSEKCNKLVEPTATVGTSSTSQELTDTAEISETEKVEEKRESISRTNGDSEDSVPPLLSAEDLSKIAATRKQTFDEEPPKLTKMTPAKRGTSNNNLAEMISKLKTRVQHSDLLEKDNESSHSKQSEDSNRLQQDFDPSSPESELATASPESVLSDNSRSEVASRTASELDFRGENNSRMPGKGNKAKVKQKPKSSLIPSAADPPSGQDLSRQSSLSAGSKRVSTRKLFDEEHCYVLDAKAYGNCGRFLNHSCSPNLFVQNVFVDTHDLRFPWVAFFAQQNISAGEELTWDYMYEIGSVQDKRLDCFCGSAKCAGRFL